MALLDTMQEIEERRDKTLEGRQRRMARGEPVKQMPISRQQLREAMANMDRIFKENRAEIERQREQRERVAQAVMQMQQQDAQGQQQGQGQPQENQAMQEADQMAQMQGQPGMQQSQSPLLNQMGSAMSQGAMGGMGQSAPQPRQQPQPQQQQMQQQPAGGLLGMGR